MRTTRILSLLAITSSLGLFAGAASAREVHNTTRTHVNTNVDRGRNVNVHRDVDVNRDVDVHRDIDVDVDRDYHPVARVAGAMVAAVAVGTVVRALPSSCSTVVSRGVTYQNCGGTWYQPRYAGTDVTYVVVNPP
ncbi:hypothetical protein [Corallococcus carmarthensis]|uniref:Uncharacterized protein n=1 Tax=Corallococcus carmarthensis TaxID=2316728 RepID=A0A3A8JYC3_9BACT|nr:hypothetical protein [Corallococcus carmarthensis]RKG97214.1 hypothetical protein D7X32_33530 [Corallococcus carmarthensis]